MRYPVSENITKIEERYRLARKTVDLNKESYWYAVPMPGYVEGEGDVAANSRDYLAQLVLLYHCDKSQYYGDAELIRQCEDYFNTMLSQQNHQGFISLLDCNIDSPPDTAFHINWYAMIYKYLQKKDARQWQGVMDKIRLFIERGADGLRSGGFHTPNHRWVISCALGFAYDMFKKEQYKIRAEEFLSEGLDINSFGEWTEKSNSIYNAACDLCLYHTATIFKKDYIFEAVRRNLNMMMYLFHPNGYIVTEYSTRQDKARKVKMGADYAIVYQFMAQMDKNEHYSWLAARAAEDSGYNEFIYIYDEVFDFKEIPQKPISSSYTVLINEGEKEKGGFGNNVLRHRRDELSVTVMENEKDMIYIQYGNIRLFGISLVVGWFGIAAVSFPVLKKTESGEYVLECRLRGSYLDVLPPDCTIGKNGNWHLMSESTRTRINEVFMTIRIKIALGDGFIDVTVESEDKPHVLGQLVCKTDLDSDISGEYLKKADDNNWLLTRGAALCSNQGYAIEISGGSFEHRKVNLRNYVTDVNAKNILLNFCTPCKKTVRFKYFKL